MPKPRLLTFQGESLSISDWARRLGRSKQTIHLRLKNGFPLAEVLTSTLRAPGSSGYQGALSALHLSALHALGRRSGWQVLSDFHASDLTRSQKHHLTLHLVGRRLVEQRTHPGHASEFRLSRRGRAELGKPHDPARFTGIYRPRKPKRALRSRASASRHP